MTPALWCTMAQHHLQRWASNHPYLFWELRSFLQHFISIWSQSISTPIYICSHGVRRQLCPATRTTSVNWAKGWSLPFFSVWQNWHNTQEGVLGHGHQEAEHPLQVQGLPPGLSTHGQNPGKFPEQMISQVGGSGSITVTPKPTSKPQPVICHPPIGVIHLNTHRCHLNNHRCRLNNYRCHLNNYRCPQLSEIFNPIAKFFVFSRQI